MAFSDAYDRFQKSTNIGYEQWHDGIGYDLDAFQAMTAEERAVVVRELKARGPNHDWRDLEVFQMETAMGGRAALRAALTSTEVVTRLHAAVGLRDLGEMPEFSKYLAAELANVSNYNGLSFALDAIGDYSPEIQAALLRGARERPDVAPHFAAKLYQLAGKSESDFDWAMRPLFLRFGETSSVEERSRAYAELCALIGVHPASG